MSYLVHSPQEREEMLAAIGVESMDALLGDIPPSLRIHDLKLARGLSEFETMAAVRDLAAANRVFADRLTFRGGGIYKRFIPTAVAAVTGKPEFYTAYTPYQPEASQGTLQAIYEFQTLIAELTAMDVANASLYDGATAVAEASMMARVHTGRDEILVAGYVHPESIEVLHTFSEGRGMKVKRGDQPTNKTAAVVFQQPDFLGLLVDARGLTERAHAAGALAIASTRSASPSLPRPVSTAPTSPSVRDSSSDSAPAMAARTSASSHARRSSCAGFPGASSAARMTLRAGAVSCSRSPRANSTSAARRPPPTSARTIRCARWPRRST